MKHALALSLALSGLCGCVAQGLDDRERVPLATHVEDWRDEVIYQLLTDRFADGDLRNNFRINRAAPARYHGGDYQGVIDHLDYLQELGVTALWISPIVLNVDSDSGVDGYHGYWQIDLERLNPHFGDLQALRALVRACHARNIKVIVDIVTNHFGQVFYYDINGNGQPDEVVSGSGGRSQLSRTTEYDPDYDPRGIQGTTSLGESGLAPIRFFDLPDIYRVPPMPAIFQESESWNRRGRVTDWNSREQVVYGDFPGGLKDVNTERPEVRAEMVRVFTDWVLRTDIDGYRIDTIKHVDYGFWEYFATELHANLAASGKGKFFLFGEAFDGDDALLGSYTLPNRVDSVFYFSQKFQVFDGVFQRGGPTSAIEPLFAARASNYGLVPQPNGIGTAPRDSLVTFIDNHDLPRFLFSFPEGSGRRPEGLRRMRAALSYLLLEDGVPCLYYGTEQDFDGGNDPANREDLWSRGGYDVDGERLRPWSRDGVTFQWIRRLTTLRRENAALRRGSFGFRWTSARTGDEQDAGLVAFERRLDSGEYALVVVNSRDKTSETAFNGSQMTVSQPPGTVLVDALGDGASYTVGPGSTLTVRVGPFGAAVLEKR